jgi:hypothetical protein
MGCKGVKATNSHVGNSTDNNQGRSQQAKYVSGKIWVEKQNSKMTNFTFLLLPFTYYSLKQPLPQSDLWDFKHQNQNSPALLGGNSGLGCRGEQ